MTEIVEAIYQNGTFKPLKPLSHLITEGKKVRITVEDEESSVNEIMKLAENFYEGWSAEEIEEIEKVMLDRSNFFGGREP